MWELLLLLVIVVGVHWWEYATTVQEYTFAQPATLEKHDELRALLSEKTPIAVEIGPLPWRPELAEKATWTVGGQSDGAVLDMPVAQWLNESPRPPIANPGPLAAEMELTNGLADLDEARPWWWLPGIWDAHVDILEPGQVLGLSWVSAERSWIGCTHGAPVTLWLVHSRYRRFLPTSVEGEPVDPWSLTVATAQWIGRVQYIEVTVKPGWCIGLPSHWGFAARATGGEAWIWTGRSHSALSHVLTAASSVTS